MSLLQSEKLGIKFLNNSIVAKHNADVCNLSKTVHGSEFKTVGEFDFTKYVPYFALPSDFTGSHFLKLVQKYMSGWKVNYKFVHRELHYSC